MKKASKLETGILATAMVLTGCLDRQENRVINSSRHGNTISGMDKKCTGIDSDGYERRPSRPTDPVYMEGACAMLKNGKVVGFTNHEAGVVIPGRKQN